MFVRNFSTALKTFGATGPWCSEMWLKIQVSTMLLTIFVMNVCTFLHCNKIRFWYQTSDMRICVFVHPQWCLSLMHPCCLDSLLFYWDPHKCIQVESRLLMRNSCVLVDIACAFYMTHLHQQSTSALCCNVWLYPNTFYRSNTKL